MDERGGVGQGAGGRGGGMGLVGGVAAVLGYGLYSMLAYIAAGQQGLGVLGNAFGFGFLTLLRVTVVVAVSSVIWVPAGGWSGFNPPGAPYLPPGRPIIASVPANLIFSFPTRGFL